MIHYLSTLQAEFERQANPKIAAGQKAYMKNRFEFYGIPAPQRKETQKPFLLKQQLPPKKALKSLVKQLWNQPQREYQMFGQELVHRYSKQLEKEDIALLEYMVTHKSWWDTVDFIAANTMGAYFQLYPELRKEYVKKWLASDHMWLQRSALLFQLKYKDQLDKELLANTIRQLQGSKEFFINKAIGWTLRQYSKTNPKWVKDFVRDTPTLANLSKREALRLII
ncbi:MAG: DNA alkylation repair protein [Cyclobacteriaceae bacterium]|nr:DNA alkylation repair protein [Cyclobacteriaceae bacterium]